jgi:hypothetical protein
MLKIHIAIKYKRKKRRQNKRIEFQWKWKKKAQRRTESDKLWQVRYNYQGIVLPLCKRKKGYTSLEVLCIIILTNRKGLRFTPILITYVRPSALSRFSDGVNKTI